MPILLLIKRKGVCLGLLWGVMAAGLVDAAYTGESIGGGAVSRLVGLPAHLAGVIAAGLGTPQTIPCLALTTLTVLAGCGCGWTLGACVVALLRLLSRKKDRFDIRSG